jgi:putative hydrolase of the HAD superfamily
MFQTALDQAGVQAHRCVHVGDHLDDDIKGANAVGMHSIWVNLDHTQSIEKTLKPSFEVNHLSEIVSAVASIETTLSENLK